jgi:hypothetical protein
LERALRASQDDVAALLPHAQHVIATRSEHYIPLDQPGLVISAIRRVVGALRPAAVPLPGSLQLLSPSGELRRRGEK